MSIKKGIYQHFKGNLYEVVDIAHHSETLEEFVVYKALYESEDFGLNSIWIRPKKMFLEDVENNGKILPRFMYLREKI